MASFYGSKGHAAYGEVLVACYDVRRDLGYSGVGMFCESVVVILAYRIHGLGVGVYVYTPFQHVVERPYVVESSRMVFVPVGEYYGVDVVDILAKHLIAEVGACIYHYGGAILRYQKGRTQTFVVSVVRAAYRAFASYYRYALRSAASENGGFYHIARILVFGCFGAGPIVFRSSETLLL